MYLVISTSHAKQSRSRALARRALLSFQQKGLPHRWIDLADLNLPTCDGGDCYSHPSVGAAKEAVANASAILLASPIYNYDVGSAAKNLIEVTGSAWERKIVGFLASAGGSTSYMSIMGFANSLMLDFRALIVPRFVYATDDAFVDFELVDRNIMARIDELVAETHRIAGRLAS